MVYTPPTHKYCFVGAKNFFVSRSWGLGKSQISWGLLFSGDLVSILGDGGRLFSSIKPSMTNHVNYRIVDKKMICFMCVC